MTQLQSRLTDLEHAWRQAGVPVDDFYAPGITGVETRATLSKAGLPAPDEVIEWFAWHNGAVKPRIGITPLGPTSWTALSLDESLRTRSDLAELAEYDEEPDTTPSYWWSDTWLPIAEDGGQGVLAIDLLERSDVCPVRNVRWSNENFRNVREDSLCDLIDVWLAILRLGGWAWSTELGHWVGEYTAIPLELRRRSLM